MKKKNGLDLFEQYYLQVFGERWPTLKQALLAPKHYLALLNPHSGLNDDPKQGLIIGESFPPSVADERGIKNYYLLDPASYFAAKEFADLPGNNILDLCAAPGGKTLVQAFSFCEGQTLVANERSADRRNRLIRVLNNYLPTSSLERIKITGHDATRWCLYEKLAYDKILLDVPCSSERHLLEKPHLLDTWKAARTKRLSMNQWTMLAGAFQVLRSGGYILYSTCALSPLENDGVIEKLFKKFPGEFNLVKSNNETAEATEHGQIFLPDRAQFGPLYFSFIQKKN